MAQELNEAINNEGKRYDELPYESFPFAISHPSRLKTLGTLFGLKPQELSKARVLELGCAAGNNIISFAANYPKAEVVGIDLSSVQIADGQKQIREIGLKNIELKVASITDLDESWGKFDYIICHGVFSWVPNEVQEKILDISKNNLTSEGIVFISYNTLPGWNMARSAREMMLYHSKNFSGLKEQIDQAKSILAFTKQATEGRKDYYSQMLDKEISLMQGLGDTYLRHEYLADCNFAFYFYEFMQKAKEHGLQYLADSHIHAMYLGNYPEKVANKLNAIGDIVRTEQYMDFITNRRFRSSLLCHATKKLNRNLEQEAFKDFYFGIDLIGNDIKETDIDSDDHVKYNIANQEGAEVTTNSKIMKVVLYTMFNNVGKEYQITELAKIAAKRLKMKDLKTIESEILTNFVKLTLAGYTNFTSEKPLYISEVREKPKIQNFAYYLAHQENKLWNINQKHYKVDLSILDKLVLQCLDGTHDIKSIEKYLISKHKQGVFNINLNQEAITDQKQIEEIISKQVIFILKKFANLAMLVA
jgi:methyltransferase-like protein/2-polyprenyl-3-methyl-5-hydroxy-6-metoxy-1,4-benzoquinol methylase